MKKMMSIVMMIWLSMVGVSWSGVLGDVNADGAIGLPEAVHALQVTSGIRPQGVTAQYDFAEYYPFSGTQEFLDKYYGSNTTMTIYPYTVQNFSVMTTATIDGETLFTNGGEYYLVNASGIYYKGYKYTMNNVAETAWLGTPVLRGSRNMTPGNVFTTFYEDPLSKTIGYEENAFLGVEDVTTPAGTFPGCVKMLRKKHTSTGMETRVIYYANAGLRPQPTFQKLLFQNFCSTYQFMSIFRAL